MKEKNVPGFIAYLKLLELRLFPLLAGAGGEAGTMVKACAVVVYFYFLSVLPSRQKRRTKCNPCAQGACALNCLVALLHVNAQRFLCVLASSVTDCGSERSPKVRSEFAVIVNSKNCPSLATLCCSTHSHPHTLATP